jgi:hypothetical protein
MQAKHPESPLFARGYSPFVVPPESSAPPGSISGIVVPARPPPIHTDIHAPRDMMVPTAASPEANGPPVPYARISLNPINSLDDDLHGGLPIQFSATYSDEYGNFVIKNVPPGFYALTAGVGWFRIEVKQGTETKLPNPLTSQPLATPGPLNHISFGGGG